MLPQAATEGVLQKKVFWNILEYSQENTCVGSLFNKVAACNFIKEDSITGVFLWILWNFKNICFEERQWMAAYVLSEIQ